MSKKCDRCRVITAIKRLACNIAFARCEFFAVGAKQCINILNKHCAVIHIKLGRLDLGKWAWRRKTCCDDSIANFIRRNIHHTIFTFFEFIDDGFYIYCCCTDTARRYCFLSFDTDDGAFLWCFRGCYFVRDRFQLSHFVKINRFIRLCNCQCGRGLRLLREFIRRQYSAFIHLHYISSGS